MRSHLRGYLGVSLSHLVFVRGECSQELPLLPFGRPEVVKRSREFSRDLVDLGGRDLQPAPAAFSTYSDAVPPTGIEPVHAV
jgi:hypothetical protein